MTQPPRQYNTTERRFVAFQEEAGRLRAMVGAGTVDRDSLSRSLGSVLEHLLCDFFQQADATADYWVDGFLVDDVEQSSDERIVVHGRIWCADHRDQWLVPAEASIIAPRSGGTPSRSRGFHELVVRVGCGDLNTLGDHRESQRFLTAPSQWLHEFHMTEGPFNTGL